MDYIGIFLLLLAGMFVYLLLTNYLQKCEEFENCSWPASMFFSSCRGVRRFGNVKDLQGLSRKPPSDPDNPYGPVLNGDPGYYAFIDDAWQHVGCGEL